MPVLSFKELTVWQKSMTLAGRIYELSKRLPTDERFGLASQLQRCAVSIPSNIVEGNKRTTAKDYAQFLSVASGSAAELETQLILAQNIYGISAESELALIMEVQKMLEVMRKRLLQPKTYSL